MLALTVVLTLMPKRQNTYSPYCSLYISNITNHVNLFNNQELQWLAIISFILMILMCLIQW